MKFILQKKNDRIRLAEIFYVEMDQIIIKVKNCKQD